VPDRSEGVAFLGGRLDVELGPFRLARLAAVPVRPVFVTAPKACLTITVGNPLPGDPTEAARAFGEVLDRVTRASPGDFDGFTHRYLVR
jgi:lauroyl/myristoyl acyltransferase